MASESCLFCKIISGEIPSQKVYEDDWVYAFRDIHPLAPVHVLIVPKVHIDSLNGVGAENSEQVRHVMEAVPKIAALLGISVRGYRLISNCGKDGGQTVMHLHFHLLGGEAFPSDRLF